jgi:hypothetical protein
VAKAALVILCTGPVFGVELVIVASAVGYARMDLPTTLILGALALTAGMVAASEAAAQLSRFRPGLIGGIMCTLSVFATVTIFGRASEISLLGAPLISGTTFGLTAVSVGALTGKFRSVGLITGTLVNLAGCVLAVLPAVQYSLSLWLEVWLVVVMK